MVVLQRRVVDDFLNSNRVALFREKLNVSAGVLRARWLVAMGAPGGLGRVWAASTHRTEGRHGEPFPSACRTLVHPYNPYNTRAGTELHRLAEGPRPCFAVPARHPCLTPRVLTLPLTHAPTHLTQAELPNLVHEMLKQKGKGDGGALAGGGAAASTTVLATAVSVTAAAGH